MPTTMPLAATTKPAGAIDRVLREVALNAKASFIGVADLAPAYAVVLKPSSRPPQAPLWPRAVSIGVAMNESIVNGIPSFTEAYGKHFYGQAWPAAKRVAGAVLQWLKKEGFAAGTSSILPGNGYKIAARYSGLAWIGKSCLAVTPQVGPRVAWEVVFTDAPLRPTAAKPRERACGDCQRCVDVCPAKAYTGIPFDEKDHPRRRYDTGKCSAFRKKLGNMFSVGACALCLEICPYGKKRNILLAQPPVRPPATQPTGK
jgi:ferredoxin